MGWQPHDVCFYNRKGICQHPIRITSQSIFFGLIHVNKQCILTTGSNTCPDFVQLPDKPEPPPAPPTRKVVEGKSPRYDTRVEQFQALKPDSRANTPPPCKPPAKDKIPTTTLSDDTLGVYECNVNGCKVVVKGGSFTCNQCGVTISKEYRGGTLM